MFLARYMHNKGQMGFISIIYLASRAVYQNHIQIVLSL